MSQDQNLPNRKSIRLKEYDYSKKGMYYITLCLDDRDQYLLGNIYHQDGNMILSKFGKVVNKIWNEIPKYYNGFEIHESITMPNHFHGIIEIVTPNHDTVGAMPPCSPVYRYEKYNLSKN